MYVILLLLALKVLDSQSENIMWLGFFLLEKAGKEILIKLNSILFIQGVITQNYKLPRLFR